MEIALAIFLAYLAGSIPFGLLLVKAAGLGDIRRIGSGNIGTTNVLRTGNKKLAAATLLLDGGKAAAGVLLGWWVAGPNGALAGAIAAPIGHCFPVWLGFKGGKAVASVLGAILALAWPVGVVACLVWVATAKITRYSSLAAIVSIITSPLFALWLANGRVALVCAVLALLVTIRHHANIRRLLNGTESRIGEKAGG